MAIEHPTNRSSTSRGLALALALAIGALLAGGDPSAAAPRIAIPEGLRLSAMACLAEALRLCPNALAAKDHGLSCIVGKRHELSRPCQGLADQALRLLSGQDVHLDLRRPKTH